MHGLASDHLERHLFMAADIVTTAADVPQHKSGPVNKRIVPIPPVAGEPLPSASESASSVAFPNH